MTNFSNTQQKSEFSYFDFHSNQINRLNEIRYQPTLFNIPEKTQEDIEEKIASDLECIQSFCIDNINDIRDNAKFYFRQIEGQIYNDNFYRKKNEVKDLLKLLIQEVLQKGTEILDKIDKNDNADIIYGDIHELDSFYAARDENENYYKERKDLIIDNEEDQSYDESSGYYTGRYDYRIDTIEMIIRSNVIEFYESKEVQDIFKEYNATPETKEKVLQILKNEMYWID